MRGGEEMKSIFFFLSFLHTVRFRGTYWVYSIKHSTDLQDTAVYLLVKHVKRDYHLHTLS